MCSLSIFRESELALELEKTKRDLSRLDKQLMEAIQQKIELSEQLEDWQVRHLFSGMISVLTSQLFNQTISQSTNHAISRHSFNQSISQSNNQSVNNSVNTNSTVNYTRCTEGIQHQCSMADPQREGVW